MQSRMSQFRVRQGDVLVLGLAARVAVATLSAVPVDGRRTVLAYGEVTGHAHALPAAQATLYGMSDDLAQLLGIAAQPGDRVLDVREDTALTHEEHDTIPIPAGQYLVRRQREWTDADEPRQVAD